MSVLKIICPKRFPSSGTQILLKDTNDFQWKIVRDAKGLWVQYCGDPYFKETYIEFTVNGGERKLVENTGTLFIAAKGMEVYNALCHAISTLSTDQIWEHFELMTSIPAPEQK